MIQISKILLHKVNIKFYFIVLVVEIKSNKLLDSQEWNYDLSKKKKKSGIMNIHIHSFF